jgi:outer membrane biosynthesis protein TonB
MGSPSARLRLRRRRLRLAAGGLASVALHVLLAVGLGRLVRDPGGWREEPAPETVSVSTVEEVIVGPPLPPGPLPFFDAAETAAEAPVRRRPRRVAAPAVPAQLPPAADTEASEREPPTTRPAPTSTRPAAAELPAERRPLPVPSHSAGRGPESDETPAPPATGPTDGGAPTAVIAKKPGPPSAKLIYLTEVKRRLRAAWHAAEVYERLDPQGRLRGSLFITSFEVRLRANGSVERADLKASSGMSVLDGEAKDALGRAQLPPLPPQIIDGEGGLKVRCEFHLDVGMFRFADELRGAIGQVWRPSKAFQASAEFERVTIVRMMVNRDGSLVNATVMQSAGIDFLDSNALEPLKPGLRFPPPPPGFGNGPQAAVFVGFAHRAGQVRMLLPKEDIDAE